jgi:prevent-host-death family protein
MKTLAAKEAKNRFGELLDTSRVGPVAIEKHGRRVAVMLSAEEYDRLEAMEHAYWTERAAKAEAKGYLGPKESEMRLGKLLRAED